MSANTSLGREWYTVYTWKLPLCLRVHTPTDPNVDDCIPLLIHPIGVGSLGILAAILPRMVEDGRCNPIYNPDLLGCGMICLMWHTQPTGLSSCNTFRDGGAKPVIVVVQVPCCL